MAQGCAEAEVTNVQAENKSREIIAHQESIVAEKNAESIKIEGTAEGELAKVLGLRRLFEFLNAKLEVIKAIGKNPNLKIYGNTDDSSLSQMAAYGLLQNNNR